MEHIFRYYIINNPLPRQPLLWKKQSVTMPTIVIEQTNIPLPWQP